MFSVTGVLSQRFDKIPCVICRISIFDSNRANISIYINFSVEKFEQILCESNVEFKHIDLEDLGLFLSMTTAKEELEATYIYRYCPTRPNKGRAPTLMSSGTNKSVEKPDSDVEINE